MMLRSLSPGALARTASRRPWLTIGIWVLAFVLAIGIMGSLGLKTTTDFTFTNDPDSQVGLEMLEDAGLVE